MTLDAVPDSADARRALSPYERAFLEYIDANQLRLPRCPATRQWLPLKYRPEPDEPVEWVAASGLATLYSIVRYHRQYSDDFKTPYCVALVELSEGVRLTSIVPIDAAAQLRIGMTLRATFVARGRLSFLLQP